MNPLRGLCIGAGYFSRFHFDAWRRMDGVRILAVVDQDEAKASAAAREFSIPKVETDPRRALDTLKPDFIDIITPPPTHLELIQLAAARGIPVICQKPLAPDFADAQRIVQVAADARIPLMVHENFRFQPWHREIKRLLDTGAVGRQLFTLTFRSRMGDGWGPDAYLARQPYFRTMPRLLVHETGVHFIDTFRYLAGEITETYAILRRLNPAIAGEDAGLLTFRFANGAVGVWDANRYNEPANPDFRYTFGEFLIEADGGTIRLYADGRLTLQPLGQPESEHPYSHTRTGFAGDCVYHTQKHFIDQLRAGKPFETDGPDYLRTLRVVEAAYESARIRLPVPITADHRKAPRSTQPPANS